MLVHAVWHLAQSLCIFDFCDKITPPWETCSQSLPRVKKLVNTTAPRQPSALLKGLFLFGSVRLPATHFYGFNIPSNPRCTDLNRIFRNARIECCLQFFYCLQVYAIDCFQQLDGSLLRHAQHGFKRSVAGKIINVKWPKAVQKIQLQKGSTIVIPSGKMLSSSLISQSENVRVTGHLRVPSFPTGSVWPLWAR